MQITIYRGAKEIGGTLIEVKIDMTRILIDAGYPLFLNKEPIDDNIAMDMPNCFGINLMSGIVTGGGSVLWKGVVKLLN